MASYLCCVSCSDALSSLVFFFFFQAEDGIRDLVRSRGLGDVYKRQVYGRAPFVLARGEGSTLYDTEGRAYLDCVAGIAVNALGYNDAGVGQAMSAVSYTHLTLPTSALV